MMYSPRSVFIFIVLFVWGTMSAEELENEYEIIDGIKVRKDSMKKEINQSDQRGKKERKQPSGPETKGSEDIEEEQYVDEDDDDDDDVEEDLEATKHLPTKCHVCRLLAVEVENKLAKIARIRKPRENRSPIYYKEEKVMLRVMEDLCDVMMKYNIRPKNPFRYKRGVKSQYRKQIEEATKDSKVQRWVWATPEEDIDDPTGEIRRLKTQCQDMLVDFQHDLIHWFMKAQSRDLTKWLCAKRVLVDDNQDCLGIEMQRRHSVLRNERMKSAPKDNETNNDVLHEEL